MRWLVIDEMQERADLERERMKYTILAGNINLWRELYEEEEKLEGEAVDWITPRSAEELEQFLAEFHSMQGGETF